MTTPSIPSPAPSRLRLFPMLLGFSLISSLASSWVAPKLIAWYYDSPANPGINCTPAVTWAMHSLQIAQAVGAAVGAILGIVAWQLLRSRNKK